MVIDPHGVKVRLKMRQRLPQLIEKVGRAAAIDWAGRHVPPKAQITHETGLLYKLPRYPRAAPRFPVRNTKQTGLAAAFMPRWCFTAYLAIGASFLPQYGTR
jgi:hypothetical protein